MKEIAFSEGESLRQILLSRFGTLQDAAKELNLDYTYLTRSCKKDKLKPSYKVRLELAVQNLNGMKQSMEAMYEASHFEENEPFADRLLKRAIEVFEIGEAMNANSPV